MKSATEENKAKKEEGDRTVSVGVEGLGGILTKRHLYEDPRK